MKSVVYTGQWKEEIIPQIYSNVSLETVRVLFSEFGFHAVRLDSKQLADSLLGSYKRKIQKEIKQN
jgi:hypothetical protein